MLKSLFILTVNSGEVDLCYFEHLKNLDDFEFFPRLTSSLKQTSQLMSRNNHVTKMWLSGKHMWLGYGRF